MILEEVLTPQIDKIPMNRWALKKTVGLSRLKHEYEVLVKNEVWITAGKEKMFVANMETRHINNCVNCWLGKGFLVIPNGYLGGRGKWLDIFDRELRRRQ